MKQRLSSLKADNDTAVTRPGHKELQNYVFPLLRKAYRTSKNIPTELVTLEDKFVERVLWPRSIYRYSVLVQQTEPFKSVDDFPYQYDADWNGMSICWERSADFHFRPDTKRNQRALSKAAGLPSFGKKKDAIADAIQYNEGTVLPSLDLGTCYSIMPGFRTQQSHPDEPKVRLVWSIPVHIWHLECMALDDAIDKTIVRCSEGKADILPMYFDWHQPIIQDWMSSHSKVTQWVNLDASAYDSTVQRSELADAWQYFAGDYEAVDLMTNYSAMADLVMPDGNLQRSGGMPSGSKLTNLGDGYTNVRDMLEVLRRLKLDRYLECILVNGDDITLGFSTRFTDDNLKKVDRESRRNISVDKSIRFSDGVWNSKVYITSDLKTRPIFRALNSMMYSERRSNAITGGKEYVAIARAQILWDVEEHPLFDVFAKEVRKYDEAHIAELVGTSRWNEALEQYVSDHDYEGIRDAKDYEQKLLKTRWASEFQ